VQLFDARIKRPQVSGNIMAIESLIMGHDRWEGQMAHPNERASSDQAYKR